MKWKRREMKGNEGKNAPKAHRRVVKHRVCRKILRNPELKIVPPELTEESSFSGEESSFSIEES